MTTWTNDELTRIEHADELQMAPVRGDGRPPTSVPIWVVRDGDGLYVRSFRGRDGRWYRAAAASGAGHVRSGGIDKDVTLVAAADAGVNDRIDAAYRSKYGHYGARYVDPLVAARDTTLKLTPR